MSKFKSIQMKIRFYVTFLLNKIHPKLEISFPFMPHGQDNYLLTKIIFAIPCKGRQTARVLSSRVCGWNGSAFHSSTWLKGVQIRPVIFSSKLRPITEEDEQKITQT